MKKSAIKVVEKTEDKEAVIIELLRKSSDAIVELLSTTLTPTELITACKNKKFSDVQRLNRVALDYDNKGNEAKAFEIYKYVATLNHANAMGNVALYYFEGLLPCQKDLDKALEWCNKAISTGAIHRNLLKANILKELGKYNDAAICLKEVGEKQKQDATILGLELDEKKKKQLQLRKSLQEYHFENALEILESNDINKKYKYDDGESILHIYFNAILSGMDSENVLQAVQEDEEFYCQLLPAPGEILNFFIENNFSFNEKNNDDLFPLDFFKKHKQACISTRNHSALYRLNQFEKQVISILDCSSKILAHGKKYVPNLFLKMGSKTPKKECDIDDVWNGSMFQDDLNLDLHERLNLARTYLTKKAERSVINLVVANIGFVVSDGDWEKGIHARKFITFPLTDDKMIILGDSGQAVGTHSEDELIRFLNANVKNIPTLLEKYIDKKFQTKIYAVILDIDSTIEVCEYCTISVRNLQKNYDENSFMHKLQDELIKKGFVLPNRDLLTLEKPDSTRGQKQSPNIPVLRLVVRASGFGSFSDTQYLSSEKAEYVPTSDLPEKYERNIKKHSLGILFHLFPKQHPNSERLEKYKEETYKITLDAVVKRGFFSLYLQTGFANSQGTTKTQQRKDLDLEGVEVKDDFVRLDKIQDIKTLKAALKKI